MRLPQDEHGLGRRGRIDIKRVILRDLDKVEIHKRLLSDDKSRYNQGMDEGRNAEAERGANAPETSGSPGVEGRIDAGAEGGLRRKRELSDEDETAAYQKVVELLVAHPSPQISPVGRLRSTLHSYQASRNHHRSQLKSILVSLDVDRGISLKRRVSNLPREPMRDAKSFCKLVGLEAEKDMLEQHIQDNMKDQYLWYRELWLQVQHDRKNLPSVAHFIFDYVKQVLEYGIAFTKDMYYAMLNEIENFEFSQVVARLVISMLDGIADVTQGDLIAWFKQNRGEVPQQIALLTGSEQPENAQTPSVRPGFTFITE